MRFTNHSFAAACLVLASMQTSTLALADDASAILATPIPATTEIATTEIATTEIAATEIAATEIAATEIAATEIAATEIAAPEIAAPEIAAPDMATPEILAFGEQVTDADLATFRGGSALQINEMKLDSKLYNNQAIANVTGSNFVTQDAFSGASGFSTVVQNSGNNVIIQNATILNISLH